MSLKVIIKHHHERWINRLTVFLPASDGCENRCLLAVDVGPFLSLCYKAVDLRLPKLPVDSTFLPPVSRELLHNIGEGLLCPSTSVQWCLERAVRA